MDSFALVGVGVVQNSRGAVETGSCSVHVQVELELVVQAGVDGVSW